MDTKIYAQDDAAGSNADGRNLYDGWSEMLTGFLRRGTDLSEDTMRAQFLPVVQGALGDVVRMPSLMGL